MLTLKIQEEGAGPESTVEHYLKIIDALDGNRSLNAPLLLVADDEEQKFDKKFINISKPYGVFITGAQYGSSKCWPPEHFSELANKIIEKYDMKIYLLPGKNEEETTHKIVEGIREKDSVEVKSINVMELKVCLSRSAFVVSNDTGPRHISAALSVPTVVLLGPMDDRYTDYPSPCTYKISKDIACRPCNKKACGSEHECLTGIRPDEVLNIIGGIIEKKQQNTTAG